MIDPLLLPGDPAELGGYELLGRLGRGGMGTVFLGRERGGRLVAVKMIRPEFADDAEFRGRFRSEVNRARQVPPFCTAEVLDADPSHIPPYLVFEYVDGPSLTQVIARRGPLEPVEVFSVAVGVATALAAIHGAGVIHRDLKPSNVLFPRTGDTPFDLSAPKVIDFGVARAMEMTSHHTRTDQMIGTVAYMSPERFDSDHDHPIGPATDIFAWGAVVTYAGTGRTPFRADSPAATAARILTQPPDLSGLPEPLRRLVARSLAKDPAERPSAHELLDLLLSTDADEETERIPPELLRTAVAARRTAGVAPPPPVPPPPVPPPPAPSSPVAAGIAAVAVPGLGVSSIVVSLNSAWGGVLGLTAVIVGAVVLLSARRLGRPARTATIGGLILGLVPTGFYAWLLLILAGS